VGGNQGKMSGKPSDIHSSAWQQQKLYWGQQEGGGAAGERSGGGRDARRTWWMSPTKWVTNFRASYCCSPDIFEVRRV
jgi:hypothetical protein